MFKLILALTFVLNASALSPADKKARRSDAVARLCKMDASKMKGPHQKSVVIRQQKLCAKRGANAKSN